MNRRNFFKVVTGFVAGIFATSAKSNSPIIRSLMKVNPEVGAKRRSGTRYCGEASTGIDPNSEWAKQKPLYVAKGGGIVYFPKGTYNLKYGIIV